MYVPVAETRSHVTYLYITALSALTIFSFSLLSYFSLFRLRSLFGSLFPRRPYAAIFLFLRVASYLQQLYVSTYCILYLVYTFCSQPF